MPRLILLRGVIGAGKSTVAKLIAAFRGDIAVIEVDDAKRENPANNGTARNCQPEVDFSEAGRRARVWLERGYHALVIEYFNEREHLEHVVRAASRKLDSEDVSIVWLDCDWYKVSLRKLGEHPHDFLKQQYKRKEQRYRHKGEMEYDTSNKSPKEVAREVLSRLDLEGVRSAT